MRTQSQSPPFLLVLALAKGTIVISVVLIFTSCTAAFLLVDKWMQVVATITLQDGHPKSPTLSDFCPSLSFGQNTAITALYIPL